MIGHTRDPLPGRACFFTLSLTDRNQCNLVDHIDHLRDAFFLAKQDRPFAMPAVVILPDHLHAVWQLPNGDTDYAARWNSITAQFACAMNAGRGAAATQPASGKAFELETLRQHVLTDEADLKRHSDYIHFDPVKHGLVARAADWPHSSFHNHVRNSLLPRDWNGSRDLIRQPGPAV